MFPLPILLIKFIIKPIIDVKRRSMYLLCSKSIEQFFLKCAKISNEIKLQAKPTLWMSPLASTIASSPEHNGNLGQL
jgi:hypothetical protein